MSPDAIVDEKAAHQAYRDAIAKQPTPLPGRPPEEPAVQLAPEADGSPSAVREAEARLILRHTHLSEEYPKALLAAHKRIKNPVRRKVAK